MCSVDTMRLDVWSHKRTLRYHFSLHSCLQIPRVKEWNEWLPLVCSKHFLRIPYCKENICNFLYLFFLSYTHLDIYDDTEKRQPQEKCPVWQRKCFTRKLTVQREKRLFTGNSFRVVAWDKVKNYCVLHFIEYSWLDKQL